jgi:thiamine-phosphate pyrophosphorylase
LDLALQIEADGVHLGKTDLNHHLDRKALKSSTKDIILGFSASNIHEAVEAEADGADYLGVGPIFPTMTKTDFSEITGLINLEQICLQSHVPVVAIGGIKLENMGKVLACGVSHIAVISAICSQIDPEKATHHFLLNICQK